MARAIRASDFGSSEAPEIQTIISERLLSLIGAEFQEEGQALIDAHATIRVLRQKS